MQFLSIPCAEVRHTEYGKYTIVHALWHVESCQPQIVSCDVERNTFCKIIIEMMMLICFNVTLKWSHCLGHVHTTFLNVHVCLFFCFNWNLHLGDPYCSLIFLNELL